ncbi:MAG: hypothetical protein ACO3A2_09105, partial [Bdellovibrionia bacterium]
WRVNLSLSLDLTLTDTQNQFATRGLEKMINPALTFTRWLGKDFSVSLNYAYINNISKDQNYYAYSKHIFGGGLIYRF